MSKFYRTRKKT